MAGETNTTFNLTIIEDSNLEVENETLTVGLQGTGRVCVIPAADVPIVIIDSDGKSCDCRYLLCMAYWIVIIT